MRTAHLTRGQGRGLPVSGRGVYVHARVFDHAGPETRSRWRAPPFRLPLMTTASASRLILSRLDGWPIGAPADASPPASRPTTHGSGADAVRYSFIVVDLHHLLLAGLPADSHHNPAPPVDESNFQTEYRRREITETPSGGY